MMRARYSIRRRLVSETLGVMMVMFGLIAIAAHEVARHESEEIFSARLATSARVLEALAARQLEKATISSPIVIALPKELENAKDDEPEAYGHPYETKIAFQVWRDDGLLLAKSASAPDDALSPLEPGFGRNEIASHVWRTFVLRSGQVWIVAAEKEEVRQELSNDLGMSILAPLVAGGLLLLLAVNLVVSANMAPLRDLASKIARREPESLAAIELPEAPAELVPINRELNDLLRRVKAAFEREQRFIDAAAHEIRTPIAALQVHIENAMRAGSDAEREKSLAEALIGLRRTTKLAEQLLAFSRITAKVDDEHFRPICLSDICRNVIVAQEPLLAQRGQTIGLDAPAACNVAGDPYKVERLLQNLIDNASQYGLPHGDIQVIVEEQPGRVVLSVANDGDPIPDAELGKVFAPYYRISGRPSIGSGLGLAIVKEIADQHRASVHVRRKADGQGTIVSVAFPVGAGPDGAARALDTPAAALHE